MNTIALPSLRLSSRRPEGFGSEPFRLLRVLLGAMAGITFIVVAYGFSVFVDLVQSWAAINVGMHLIP